MVPTIEGEFARKRRMMSHGWPIVVRGGMLSPRGYDPLYALMIFSHRILRYLSPFLHLVLLGTSVALLSQGWVYVAAVGVQLGCGAALVAPVPARPTAATGPLLRADHGLAGGRALGLAAARRYAGGMGNPLRARGDQAGPRYRARADRHGLFGAGDSAPRAGGPVGVSGAPDLSPDPGGQGL